MKQMPIEKRTCANCADKRCMGRMDNGEACTNSWSESVESLEARADAVIAGHERARDNLRKLADSFQADAKYAADLVSGYEQRIETALRVLSERNACGSCYSITAEVERILRGVPAPEVKS